MGDDVKPQPYSPEWHDYVMSHFTKQELREGYPTCNGLRRVTQLLYASIINTKIQVVKAPTSSDVSATVICRINYRLLEDENMWQNRTQMGAADVSKHNTDDTFAVHAVATAETRAEGRCLRKILGIDVYTAEEMTPNTLKTINGMQEHQQRAITKLSRELEIDLPKYLAQKCQCSLDDFKAGNNISDDTAQLMLSELNTWMNSSKEEIPVEIRA